MSASPQTPLLRHLQRCEQPFDDLEDGDLLVRRCGRCDVDVHNFDLLPRRDRDELLHRSDRERTVCAGTRMPVAAAPGCRDLPDPDQPPEFSRAIVIRDPLALTPQWWRIIALPAPAVIDAIRELAGAHDLRDSSLPGAASWNLHDRSHNATIVVRVQPRGDRTEIGVRVYPLTTAQEPTGANPVVVLAAVLVGVLALLLLGTYPRLLLLAALLASPLVAAIFGVLDRLDAPRPPHGAEGLAEWGDTWQRGFFTALEARLAPTTRLYR